MVADEGRIKCNVKSAMLNVGNPPMPIGPTMAAQSCVREIIAPVKLRSAGDKTNSHKS
jgi:hypothetical protein